MNVLYEPLALRGGCFCVHGRWLGSSWQLDIRLARVWQVQVACFFLLCEVIKIMCSAEGNENHWKYPAGWDLKTAQGWCVICGRKKSVMISLSLAVFYSSQSGRGMGAWICFLVVVCSQETFPARPFSAGVPDVTQYVVQSTTALCLFQYLHS